MSKIEKRFKEYVRLYDQGFTFSPATISVEESETGVTALEAFEAWESTGKKLATKEKELLLKALKGKESLNLHIKMWTVDVVVPLQELVAEFKLPSWAEKALYNQARKSFINNGQLRNN